MDGIVMNNQQNNTNYYELESVAQHSMKECFGEPLIGLQFVVEIRKNLRDKSDVYFLCAFCAMKLNTTTLLAHIKSVRHKMKFCETFIPSLFSKFGDQNRNWIASEYKELNEELTRFRKYEGPKKLAVTEQADQRNAIKFLKYLIKSSSPPDYHNRGHRITSDDRLNSSLDRNIPHPRADEQLYGSSSDHSNVESKRMPQGSKETTNLTDSTSHADELSLEEPKCGDINYDHGLEVEDIKDSENVLDPKKSLPKLAKNLIIDPSEAYSIMLDDNFSAILKEEVQKKSNLPGVSFLSDDNGIMTLLDFISNNPKFNHPILVPQPQDRIVEKRLINRTYSIKSILNMLLLHANNVYCESNKQEETLHEMTCLIIPSITKLIRLMMRHVHSIRDVCIPNYIPQHLRDHLVTAPLKSRDIWHVDIRLIQPILSMVTSGNFDHGHKVTVVKKRRNKGSFSRNKALQKMIKKKIAKKKKARKLKKKLESRSN